MVTAKDLEQTFVPFFTEPWASEEFQNVTLVSLEKKCITINACVLASVNPWCRQILTSVESENGNYLLITELPLEDLLTFKEFATTGNVAGYKSAEELLTNKVVVQILTLGYGSFGLSASSHPTFSNTTAISAQVEIKIETLDDTAKDNSAAENEKNGLDPLGCTEEQSVNLKSRKRKAEGSEEVMYHISHSKTGSYSVQQLPDYDPNWAEGEEFEDGDDFNDPTFKPHKVKNDKAMDPKVDPKCVNYWKKIAKIEAEKSVKEPHRLDDRDAPATNPDGSVSFPNGFCLKEWSAYRAVMKTQGSKTMFLKHLIAKVFNKEIPKNIHLFPDLRSDSVKAQKQFDKLLAVKKKTEIDRYEVCFTIRQWDGPTQTPIARGISTIVQKNECDPDQEKTLDLSLEEDKEAQTQSRLFHFPQEVKNNTCKNKPYQCHLCVKGYDLEESYQQHVRRHSAKSHNDAYFCLICPDYVAFPSIEEYKVHKDKCHPTGEEFREVQCVYCPEVINNKFKSRSGHRVYHSQKIFDNNMKLHMQAAHGNPEDPDGKLRHMCISCGKGFSSREGFLGHMKLIGTFHDGKCRICPDFEAKTWVENLAHLTKVHKGERQYKCGECPSYFSSDAQCKEHRLKTCKNRKPPKEAKKEVCSQCGVSVRSDYMERHLKKFHGTHKIPCTFEGCKAIIKHPDVMMAHIKSNHSPQTCELCGKLFLTLQLLKRHKNQVHTDNDRRKHICKICSKGFGAFQAYNDHLNIHTGAKPHQCKYCSSCFANTGTMNGHVRAVHLGKKRK